MKANKNKQLLKDLEKAVKQLKSMHQVRQEIVKELKEKTEKIKNS